jgi:NADPH:quinone reductase-like Zn-dependent oxidoreductase
VKVLGISVNAADLYSCAASPVLTGHPGLLRPKQQILGVDIAGQVEAVGGGVTRVRPATRSLPTF